jgi:hypothetical protein
VTDKRFSNRFPCALKAVAAVAGVQPVTVETRAKELFLAVKEDIL